MPKCGHSSAGIQIDSVLKNIEVKTTSFGPPIAPALESYATDEENQDRGGFVVIHFVHGGKMGLCP